MPQTVDRKVKEKEGKKLIGVKEVHCASFHIFGEDIVYCVHVARICFIWFSMKIWPGLQLRSKIPRAVKRRWQATYRRAQRITCSPGWAKPPILTLGSWKGQDLLCSNFIPNFIWTDMWFGQKTGNTPNSGKLIYCSCTLICEIWNQGCNFYWTVLSFVYSHFLILYEISITWMHCVKWVEFRYSWKSKLKRKWKNWTKLVYQRNWDMKVMWWPGYSCAWIWESHGPI